MNKHLLLSFTLLTLLAGSTGCTEKVIETDFEKFCGYFQALDQQDAMSAEARYRFIMHKIDQGLPANSNARAAWMAIVNAVPEERYELFKSVAEDVYPLLFDCPTMEKLAPVTGD